MGDTVLQELLEEGIREGVFTAAAAVVGVKGDTRWAGCAGRLSQDPDSPPVTPATLFDLASLTKPLATTLAVMLLVGRGELSLETTLGEVLPGSWLPPAKRSLNLKSLLAHRAGLPPWRPFFADLLHLPAEARPEALWRLAAAEPLAYAPDSATVYSDLGFMLLHAVIEALTGEPLDAFCRRELYEPLGLAALGFNPRACPKLAGRDCAATEAGLIPGRSIAGEVHDENAWAAGGVAGHAGLFGTASEVFRLLAWLYRAWEEGDRQLAVPARVLRQFLTPVAPGARTPGFDVPAPEGSSAGRFFSRRSVGHTGFTGTSFWLDLETGQMVVLLTNRVHLGRENDKIRQFRPRFHEAAARFLGLAEN